MQTITTPIIPSKPTFVKTSGAQELNREAICVFTATGFFLDTDSYFKDELVLPPASKCVVDADGIFQKAAPWFAWNHSPRSISFDQALEEFIHLFETTIDEQVGNNKVVLPLSGGLDSRTQAVALSRLGKQVHSYSYNFKNGYRETAIAQKIAAQCGFSFTKHTIEAGYLWNCIEDLAKLNRCQSEFTHARQMAIFDEYQKMGDVFSLGHWGDVLFDTPTSKQLSDREQLELLLHKIVKKGGMELAEALWQEWGLSGSFQNYLERRVADLLQQIPITHTGAKLRAFKSLYWAPRWTATNLAVFSNSLPITLPYFSDAMCKFICTVPEEFLEGRKLQIAYIKKCSPKLAKITWQEQKPFNLYTFHKNQAPANIPYRIKSKLSRELKKAMGTPYTQRNWELQFLGIENDNNLQQWLFSENLHPFISKPLMAKFYNAFKHVDAVTYSHPLSMLLTLSVWHKTIKK